MVICLCLLWALGNALSNVVLTVDGTQIRPCHVAEPGKVDAVVTRLVEKLK